MTSGVFNMTSELPSAFSLNEQVNGEGATLLLTDVVNYADPADPVPLFDYNYYDSGGVLRSAHALYGADRQSIMPCNYACW